MNAKDRAIVTRWRARLAIRQGLLRAARKRHEWNPTPASRAVIEKRKRQVGEAERVIARRVAFRPHIRALGATVSSYAPLGKVERTIGHYTAGPRDRDDDHA